MPQLWLQLSGDYIPITILVYPYAVHICTFDVFINHIKDPVL